MHFLPVHKNNFQRYLPDIYIDNMRQMYKFFSA